MEVCPEPISKPACKAHLGEGRIVKDRHERATGLRVARNTVDRLARKSASMEGYVSRRKDGLITGE